MITPQPNYYLGVITKILDPDKYEVEITIPGVTTEARAYPIDRSPDEPKPEDLVLVLGLDPVWNSVWLYQKLKENEFIGFRSRGKKVDITKDRIEIGIFSEMNEKDQTAPPYEEDSTPKSTSWIKIDKDGNIDVNAEKDMTIKVAGNVKIEVAGNADIIVSESTKLECPDVTVTGGKFTMKGTCTPQPGSPFCALPICPVSGAIHVGQVVSGT
jgi:hypothetical protein